MSDVAIGSGTGGTSSVPAEGSGQASLARRLGAEFLGTTVFVAIGTGAATVFTMGPVQRLGNIPDAGGDPVLGALLAGNFGDLMGVAFAFATALAFLVYALGGVSGAHFNPAVTFALAVARRFRWADVAPYILVQCIGGIAGAFVVAGIYGQAGALLNEVPIMFGATVVAEDIEFVNALLAEAFIGFVLVTAIMAVAVDPRAPKGWSGLIIGLGLASGILVTAAATGGSANFARSLGPFVASLLYDVKEIPWEDLAVYAAGPVIGGMAAAMLYESVTGLETVAPAPMPGAATPADGTDGAGDEIIGDNGLILKPGDPPPYNPDE